MSHVLGLILLPLGLLAAGCRGAAEKVVVLPENIEDFEKRIEGHLAQTQVDSAVEHLALMIGKFPHDAPTARACFLVATHLYDKTMLNPFSSDVDDRLRKVSQYFLRWLDQEPAPRIPMIRANETVSASVKLYEVARRLNGLDDQTVSFLDLKGRLIQDRVHFENVIRALKGTPIGGILGQSSEVRFQVLKLQARSLTFIARTLDEWLDARPAYSMSIAIWLIDNPEVVRLHGADVWARPEIASLELELAYVNFEIGQREKNLAGALSGFRTIRLQQAKGSEIWWRATYMMYLTGFSIGYPEDLPHIQRGLKELAVTYPNFAEAAKFGLQEKLRDIKVQVDQALEK